MPRGPARFTLALLLLASGLSAQQPAAKPQYSLAPTPKTIAWGYYDASTPPVLRVKSRDTVEVQTLITSSPKRLEGAGLPADQVEQPLRDIYDQVKDKGPGGHILTGPIYVEDAQPGDVLEVRIVSVRLAIPYAYNVGSMGVAPPESSGRFSSNPPWIHAGNLDNKDLVAGTTLYIPVHAAGALFEVGDGHAGQGNGEVDITALETSLIGTFQFVVRKDMHLRWPRAETPTSFITMGLHEDLNEATKLAVREMIDFLMTEKHLSRDDAYMLSSVAADLSITELVDGNKGVHMAIPKAIFVAGAAK